MRSVGLVLVGVMVLILVGMNGGVVVGAAAALGEQCAEDFQKVTACLAFATGKAAAPTKECCGSVTEIKGKDPVCLCYIIQQTHNGSDQIKSLGIQESRLIQLPSACKLANASVSDCPRLLNIPPTSPEYAMFANSSSSSASSTATPATGSSTASPTTQDGSKGSKLGPNLAGLMAIAMAILFSV